MLSPRRNGWSFQPLVTQARRNPLSREHSRVSKSTDFIINEKSSRHNAKNFDPWIRLTPPVNLNNQAIGIGYRLHLVTSAAKKADLFFFRTYCSGLKFRVIPTLIGGADVQIEIQKLN